jgi:beta-lactamase superfamily II metal-dependent hydrolase
MNSNLLVRLYRVGFGDCIYVQIPDENDVFTMLIDCGTSAAAETTLKPAVEHLITQLPKDLDGNPRLDLMVVTHPHADHMKGFDPAWFKGVTIGRIWMTIFMNQEHPQAGKALAFEKAAFTAAKSLLDRSGFQLDLGSQSLLARSMSLANTGVLSALRHDLPTTHSRLYVARDVADHLNNTEQKQHKLHVENGISTFRGFMEAGTCLRILAPEWDIDSAYMGKFSPGGAAFQDDMLPNTGDEITTDGNTEMPADGITSEGTQTDTIHQPENISTRDFRLLRNGLLHSALGFLETDDRLKNNTSVVLCLEWRGRRLLFTGDAEWDGGGVQPGEYNCSWDVMLNNPQVSQILLKPFDLFKVAHHASHNGTPSGQDDAVEILKKMIKRTKTHVVVSTIVGVHGKKNPVPYPKLLIKLGDLAANQKIYPPVEKEDPPELIGMPQPRRTDRESDSTTPGVDYLEEIIEP